jgi:MerR HTH family regulatory protein
MKAEPAWTLDQLIREVERVLVNQGPAQLNRLVREIPSERTIRFYTTEGLIDEPTGMRGHMALYGRRHLLQLVAIKRLQAEGASLEQIRQRQPRRLSTPALERLARGRAQAPPVAESEACLTIADSVATYQPAEPGFRFRTAASAPATPPPPVEGVQIVRRQSKPVTSAPSRSHVLQGVEVRDGVTVLVRATRTLTEADIEAIRLAAAPLIDALVGRGLFGGRTP